MINYPSFLEVWDIVEKCYIPKYEDDATKKLTIDSKLERKENDSAVNAILTSVYESIIILFGNSTNAHEMWNALIN